MLGKVLKYDLKAVCRYLIPLYAVLLGLGIMVRLLGFFDNISIIAIICGLMIVALVLVSVFSFVLTGIFSVKHYLENLFKDEGYLTHTLPVKKGTLLVSKVLVSLITLILTGILPSCKTPGRWDVSRRPYMKTNLFFRTNFPLEQNKRFYPLPFVPVKM